MSISKEFKTLKETVNKINWWEWIPIIGPVIYLMRVNIAYTKVENKDLRVIGKIYASIFRGIVFVISIALIICFFVFRNTHGLGPWPWFFFAGIVIGNLPNLVPILFQFLLNKSLDKFEKIWKPEEDKKNKDENKEVKTDKVDIKKEK